jgi:hypothetical protein
MNIQLFNGTISDYEKTENIQPCFVIIVSSDSKVTVKKTNPNIKGILKVITPSHRWYDTDYRNVGTTIACVVNFWKTQVDKFVIISIEMEDASAVAAGIKTALGEDDSDFFKYPKFYPDSYIYNAVLRAFNCSKLFSSLEHKYKLNPKYRKEHRIKS